MWIRKTEIEMTFITIIFVLVFIMYNWLMHTVYGNLWSISAGYYELKKTNVGWLFTLFLVFIASYLTAIVVVTHSILFFIAIVGAVFTGVATRYHDKPTKWVHYGGSGLMITFAAIGCWVSFGNWWTIAGILLSMILVALLYHFKKIDNLIYWGEHASFVWIILGVVL